ncbi:MAG: zinc-binding dehydrogenase [Gemmatimonadota bacterium]|nr:zinc-binding dehydrogenase [Gemmatimonadota bacterium]MDH5803610.1 zinc-binding dehydrogenase [Gemmatimonadota bacterium]
MRALTLRGHGDLSMLEVADVPKPDLSGPGSVVVKLHSAALNHLDLWTVRGLPGLELDFPHVIGGDGAGVIEEIGDKVKNVKPGDRVMINPGVSCYDCDWCESGEHSLCPSYRLLGEHLPGTLAEYIVLPHQNVTVIPDTPEGHDPISFNEAAAYSLVTLTAWRMLMTRAKVKTGETVLIWGVGGGVSSTAVQLARLAGAFVIATSSSDEKLKAAEALGADVTLNHKDVDVAKEVYKLTNKNGVDVVVDNVGAATWGDSVRMLSKMGRLVTCGATTGPKVENDVRKMFWHQYTLMGSTMGSLKEYREIVKLLGQGRLRPKIDSVFPLEQGADAIARMEAGEQMGKLVVQIQP